MFVFPSYYKMEGQHIVILEAMAIGNIVLATNHVSIVDIFYINNKFFVEKKTQNIAKKITMIFEDKKPHEKTIRYNYAINNFRSKKFINNIESILMY